MVKKQRSFASRSSSSSRPGLERAVYQADQTGSAADGPDDDAASALSRSSSGGECVHGSKLSFAALTLLTVRTPYRAILPWARYLQDRSPLSEWKDPLLATLVITPG